MDFNNLAHSPVFPEFIPVAQLYIGKSVAVIMIQRGKVQIVVFQKVIVGISAAPVAVTDNNIAVFSGQRQYGGILKGIGQTGIKAHKFFLYNNYFNLFYVNAAWGSGAVWACIYNTCGAEASCGRQKAADSINKEACRWWSRSTG